MDAKPWRPPNRRARPSLKLTPTSSLSSSVDLRDGLGASPSLSLGLIVLIFAGVFAVRFTGPCDLMDNDQERPAAYALDVTRNGHWICQRDATGAIASKPPLYTWLVVLASAPFGRVSLFTLYLPGALAVLALAGTVFAVGGALFGRGAGMLGAAAFLVSTTSLKQVCLARTDALFALTVFWTALCAWRAWTTGRGWTWFWLAAAAATLTKGPLGLALAGGGLLAAVWERRRPHAPLASIAIETPGDARPPAPGGLLARHVPGLALFLLITAGWFALACLAMGREVLDKMILKELVGHAVKADNGGVFPGQEFYKPFLYFLSRFAPWSVFACVGLWRVWRRPAQDAAARRLERFLACFFLAGLALFSIAPHQRPDHLTPILPAAAILAGRELARLVSPRRFGLLLGAVAATAAAVLVVAAIYYHSARAQDEATLRIAEAREIADFIRREVGSEFPLIHTAGYPNLDSPFALQFFLNTMRPNVWYHDVARALASDHAAYAIVRKWEHVEDNLGDDPPPIYEIKRWRAWAEHPWRLLSNRPQLRYWSRMATWVGPIYIEMDGAHLRDARGQDLTFWAKAPACAVSLTNGDNVAHFPRVRILNVRPEVERAGLLAPGQTWRIEAGSRREPTQSLTVGQVADHGKACATRAWLARTNAFDRLDYVFVHVDPLLLADWRGDLFLKQATRWGPPIFPVLTAGDPLPPSGRPTEPFQNRFGYLEARFDDGPARFVLPGTGRQPQGNDQGAKEKSSRPTAPGPPRVIVVGGAEDRLGEDGAETWLEMEVSPDGVIETRRPIPSPSAGARLGARLRWRDLFWLRRSAPIALFVLVLIGGLGWGARRALRAFGSNAEW